MSDGIIEEKEYQKDKEEFGDTLDAIFSADSGVSDEEINKTLDEALGKKLDGSGESNDDPTKKANEPSSGAVDPDPDPDPNQAKEPDIVDPDQTEWKAKYEESENLLEKERQKTKSWDGRIQAANKRAKDAEIALQKLLESKPAEPSEEDISDQEKLDKFRSDFPELGDVVDIMEKRISKVTPKEPVKDTEPDPEPAVESEEVDTTHTDTIIKEHPDLNEMVNTGVLSTWINQQGDLLRPTLQRIYEEGTAKEVITMLAEFKNKSGWKSQLTADPKMKEKEDKLNAMKDVGSHSGGPIDNVGPDKNDYDKGVEDAFKEEKS